MVQISVYVIVLSLDVSLFKTRALFSESSRGNKPLPASVEVALVSKQVSGVSCVDTLTHKVPGVEFVVSLQTLNAFESQAADKSRPVYEFIMTSGTFTTTLTTAVMTVARVRFLLKESDIKANHKLETDARQSSFVHDVLQRGPSLKQ